MLPGAHPGKETQVSRRAMPGPARRGEITAPVRQVRRRVSDCRRVHAVGGGAGGANLRFRCAQAGRRELPCCHKCLCRCLPSAHPTWKSVMNQAFPMHARGPYRVLDAPCGAHAGRGLAAAPLDDVVREPGRRMIAGARQQEREPGDLLHRLQHVGRQGKGRIRTPRQAPTPAPPAPCPHPYRGAGARAAANGCWCPANQSPLYLGARFSTKAFTASWRSSMVLLSIS